MKKEKFFLIILVVVITFFSFVYTGNADSADVPGSSLQLVTANKQEGIIGTYQGKTESISFSLTQDRATGDRIGIFTASKSNKIAKIVVHANGELQLTIENIKWKKGKKLSAKQQKTLKKFGQTDLARAILETAAYSFFKIPAKSQQGSLRHQATAMQFYEAISPYYSTKNKKLIQPADFPISESCSLKSVCDLITDNAVFGCKMGGAKKVDILVLIDGSPSECRLK